MKHHEPSVDFDWELVDAGLTDLRASAQQIYRAAAMRLLPVLHAALEAQLDSPAKWACMFATSHPACQGRSMADVAVTLGVSRASLSSLARTFCDRTGLPPSSYMRSEDASRLARKIRLAVVEKKKQQPK